ncbi:MAG: hypothetical protein ACPLXP_00405, partial [Microgenomates group bacterium]
MLIKTRSLLGIDKKKKIKLIFKTMRRLLVFIATIIFLLAVFPPGAKANFYEFQQELKRCAETNSTSFECWIAGSDLMNEKASPGVITGTMKSLITAIIGELPSSEELNQQQIPYKGGGAIGGITNLIAAMYANPPASSVEYFADLGRNLGIVKP